MQKIKMDKNQNKIQGSTFVYECGYALSDRVMKINNRNIKIIGTIEEPWICGKELCEALGYKNSQSSLKNVKQKHKTVLSELQKLKDSCNFFWPFTSEIKYHEGKAVYISEHGAYHLAMKCELRLYIILKSDRLIIIAKGIS